MQNYKSNPKNTVLVISMGLLIIYLMMGWKPAVYASLGIGLIGVFSDVLSKKIEFVWMKLAWVLSLIVPNILLSIVFFFILCPIAFMSRVFGKKDPLMLKSRKESMYKKRDYTFNKGDFEKPW